MKWINFSLLTAIFNLSVLNTSGQTALNFNSSMQYQPASKGTTFTYFERNSFDNRTSLLQAASRTIDNFLGDCPRQFISREPEGTVLWNYWKEDNQTELVEEGNEDCGSWGPISWGACKRFIRAGVRYRVCGRTNVYQDKHNCYYLPIVLGGYGMATQTHFHGGQYKKTFNWTEEDFEWEMCGSWALLPEVNDALATVSPGKELVVTLAGEKSAIIVGSRVSIAGEQNLPPLVSSIKYNIDGLDISKGQRIFMNTVGEHLLKASITTKSGGSVKVNQPFYVIKPVTVEEITQKNASDNGEIHYTVKIQNNNMDGSGVAWVSTSSISKEGFEAFIKEQGLHQLAVGKSALINILFRPTKFHRVDPGLTQTPVTFDFVVSCPGANGLIIDKKTITAQPVAISTPGGIVGNSGPQKVSTISVKTIEGEVIDVKVPNIIRPGTSITGSAVTKTQSATLEGVVIDVQNKKSNVKDRLFKFIVPAGLTTIPFLLKDKYGATIGSGEIPVNRPNIPVPGNNIILPPQQIELTPRHAPGSFAPMNYCQPGQPLTINGFFDGDASNTHVSINNIPCEMIAESSTGCFIQVPDNMPGGRQTLTINEQSVTESIPVQVVTTNLSTNKSIVQKNTRAKVTLTVNNLENIDLNNNNFKVELINGSPNVIQFRNATSNSLSWNLTTENVRNGIFTTTVDVQGIAVGSYTVSANLSSTTCTDCWKQYEACIAAVEADEKKCYDACDKAKAGTACYLACSTAARAQEIECFAQYVGCMRKKLGF